MKMVHFFIFFWVGIGLAAISWLHSNHYAVFSNRAPSAIKANNSWGIVHVLGGECGCSQNVANYLLKRGPIKGYSERIILIGEFEQASKLKEQGFEFLSLELADIEGVPMFMVHDQKGEVLHAGGYTAGMAGPLSDFQDAKTFQHLVSGQSVESLPVKGCAVAQKIRESIDPLGLKYSKRITYE